MSLNTLQVAALYVAVYNRAPDAAGLTYWTTDFTGSYADAAAGFVSHPLFVQDYANLTKQQIVEKFYTNILGSAGDTAGIDYWVARLEAGEDMGLVLSEFINATLTGDFTGDSAALARQATLVNKSEVGIYYAEKLGAKTNMDAATYDPASVNVANDPAFIAGKNAIATVTDNASSVTVAKDAINKLSPDNTFTLTANTDIATSNVFESGLAYNPGGTDRVNTLQDEDQLTGSGINPTLNATLGNANDNGATIITPELNDIETVNVAFTGSAATAVIALDLQDATGLKEVNVTRVSQVANRAEVGNIRDAIGTMSVSDTQANQNGVVEFSFANGVLAGENTGAVRLSNVALNTLNVGQNTSGINGIGVGINGYENLTIDSVGAANSVTNLNLPMDTGTNGTITITGDKALTLGSSSNTVNANNMVEGVRHDGGIQGNYGRLAAVDASGLNASLTMNIAAGMLTTGKADTSGQNQDVTITGTAQDDTFYLNDTVQAGDVINGGDGTDTLVFTNIGDQNIAAAATPNLTNIDAFEIRTGHDTAAGVGQGDTVNVDADAFDALASVYVRNEGQQLVVATGVWTSAAEAMTVNLNNLTAEQAQAITLAHGTTGNSTITNNIVNINLKTGGAADAAKVTIVDGVNTDPVFNAQINANGIERVTLVDSDTESNTIHLTQGAFTQAGSTITAQGGAAGQYLNLDSFGIGGAFAAGATDGYGYATDSTVGSSTTAAALLGVRDNAVSTVFTGTAGTAIDNATRHVVENVDASEYAGDFIIRVGDLTRADGTTSMNIKTGVGNDTVIFDAIGSTSAGFTSGDTVAMGAGTDTLVLDGNTSTIPGTPRIDHQTSEWDNLSGVDVLRFGNNAGVVNTGGPVANASGAYYVHIDNDFVSQTDAGDRLTIVNNDGRLDTNTESDVVVDIRGLSANKFVTFVGANGNGTAVGPMSSNRIVLDDTSAKSGQFLNGGDTDVTVSSGNNNVYEVRNTANVSLDDLANVKNFRLINFTNDQAVDQTLTLTLNNAVVENLVDGSQTATSAATQEILNIVATDGAAVSAALNIDARDVTGFHGLNVTGSVLGNDVVTLDANVGGTASTLALGASTGDRVNWVGTANGALAADGIIINHSGGVLSGFADDTHSFTTNATSTTHSVTGVEIFDISGMIYNSSTINVSTVATGVTVIGGNQVDVITGGVGNDTITGGAGADTITTGGGTDQVNYVQGALTFAQEVANTGTVATGAIDVITDFASGTDTINFTVAGAAQTIVSAGIANANYAAALVEADAAFAADVVGQSYFVAAYGAGGAWTSVLFIDSDGAAGGTADGAIQIGLVGAYATEALALNAIAAADIV